MEITQSPRILDPKALTLVCDVKTTRRLKRHIIYAPKGHLLYAAKSVAEALDYLSSADVSGFWLAAGERSLWVNLSPAASPLPDPNQQSLVFSPDDAPTPEKRSPLDVLQDLE